MERNRFGLWWIWIFDLTQNYYTMNILGKDMSTSTRENVRCDSILCNKTPPTPTFQQNVKQKQENKSIISDPWLLLPSRSTKSNLSNQNLF